MKVEMHRNAYGFGMDWVLVAYGRRLWLGQDAKVCSRILGASPRDVVIHVGSPHIQTNKTANTKLARLLCEAVGLNRSTANKFEPWSAACE
tara:strand:- start:8426 stop:8698 length:273 start_codon:yes stop_codon:yes gene_type:complete